MTGTESVVCMKDVPTITHSSELEKIGNLHILYY